MWSNSPIAGVSIAVLLSLISPVVSQSIPGASLFVGGGVPGGTYALVDDYEPSVFFSKFNFYNVSQIRDFLGDNIDEGIVIRSNIWPCAVSRSQGLLFLC